MACPFRLCAVQRTTQKACVKKYTDPKNERKRVRVLLISLVITLLSVLLRRFVYPLPLLQIRQCFYMNLLTVDSAVFSGILKLIVYLWKTVL